MISWLISLITICLSVICLSLWHLDRRYSVLFFILIAATVLALQGSTMPVKKQEVDYKENVVLVGTISEEVIAVIRNCQTEQATIIIVAENKEEILRSMLRDENIDSTNLSIQAIKVQQTEEGLLLADMARYLNENGDDLAESKIYLFAPRSQNEAADLQALLQAFEKHEHLSSNTTTLELNNFQFYLDAPSTISDEQESYTTTLKTTDSDPTNWYIIRNTTTQTTSTPLLEAGVNVSNENDFTMSISEEQIDINVPTPTMGASSQIIAMYKNDYNETLWFGTALTHVKEPVIGILRLDNGSNSMVAEFLRNSQDVTVNLDTPLCKAFSIEKPSLGNCKPFGRNPEAWHKGIEALKDWQTLIIDTALNKDQANRLALLIEQLPSPTHLIFVGSAGNLEDGQITIPKGWSNYLNTAFEFSNQRSQRQVMIGVDNSGSMNALIPNSNQSRLQAANTIIQAIQSDYKTQNVNLIKKVEAECGPFITQAYNLSLQNPLISDLIMFCDPTDLGDNNDAYLKDDEKAQLRHLLDNHVRIYVISVGIVGEMQEPLLRENTKVWFEGNEETIIEQTRATIFEEAFPRFRVQANTTEIHNAIEDEWKRDALEIACNDPQVLLVNVLPDFIDNIAKALCSVQHYANGYLAPLILTGLVNDYPFRRGLYTDGRSNHKRLSIPISYITIETHAELAKTLSHIPERKNAISRLFTAALNAVSAGNKKPVLNMRQVDDKLHLSRADYHPFLLEDIDIVNNNGGKITYELDTSDLTKLSFTFPLANTYSLEPIHVTITDTDEEVGETTITFPLYGLPPRYVIKASTYLETQTVSEFNTFNCIANPTTSTETNSENPTSLPLSFVRSCLIACMVLVVIRLSF